MKTKEASVANRTQAAKSDKGVVRAFDSLHALLETEYRSCEAIGVSQDEPEHYLKDAWQQLTAHPLPSLCGMPATCFRTPGQLSMFSQIHAMAADGWRVAFLSSRREPVSDARAMAACAPFVLHQLTTTPVVNRPGPFFQLIARSPQHAVDLCLIARRIAELSLLPGILSSRQNYDHIDYEMVATADQELLNNYLGLPADKITAPTPTQQQHFGVIRRRIPILSARNVSLISQALLADVPDLCDEAMREFKKCTGRSYGPVEEIKTANAEIVIIAVGGKFDFLHENLGKLARKTKAKIGLLHPTLIAPFPGSIVSETLKRKKACLVLSESADPQSDPILREIERSFERAFANGLALTTNGKNMPFPDYPAYKYLQDRPQLFAGCTTDKKLDLGILYQAITSIDAGAPSPVIPDLSFANGHTETKRTRASSQHSLNIAIGLPDANEIGRKLAETCYNLLHFNIALQGSATADRVCLQFVKKPTGQSPAKSGADVIVSTTPLLRDLEAELQDIRNNGAWLLLAKEREISAIWRTLPQTQRALLDQKKCRCFQLEAETQLAENDSCQNGELLGGLFKISETINSQIFTHDQITAAMEILASNCNLQFAEAVQRGFTNVREIDFSQLQSLPDETLLDHESSTVHEEQKPDTAEDNNGKTQKDYLKEQLRFCLTGEKPKPTASASTLRLTPALLMDYEDLTKTRYAYPVCLPNNEPDLSAIPLTKIFDRLIDETSEVGDNAERIQHDLLQLEAEIKRQIAPGSLKPLSQLWDEATSSLLEKSTGDAQNKEKRRQTYHAGKQALQFDGVVIGCDEQTPARLMHAAHKVAWTQKSKAFNMEMDALAASLVEIMQADFTKTAEAQNPEYLEATIGQAYSDELDFERLSGLLAESLADEKHHERRRQRIENVWLSIKEWRKLFLADEAGCDTSAAKAPELYSQANNIAGAIGEALAHFRRVLEFFRAVHIARLEVQNKYRDDKHDAYFAAFDFSHLTADEIALIPPYLVHITNTRLSEIDRNALVELLATELPVKVLLTVDGLDEGEILDTRTISFSSWTSKIADMARSLNSAFVLQATSSQLEHLIAGLQDGMLYDGPALFCIFSGADSPTQKLAPYLQSAAALESRMYPAFTYNPASGDTWAEKFNIEATPQFEKDWPVNTLTYENVEVEQISQEFVFTPADFFATDARYSGHFLPVSRQDWHDRMTPAADFVADFQENIGQKVPFVWMVAGDGALRRVIISYAMAAVTARRLYDWRNLQELGGVNNSHAQKLLQQEKSRLEEEKRLEIEALEAKHRQALDKAVAEVAHEVVSNIAAGLLDQSSVAQPAMAALMPTPAKAEPAPQPEAEQSVEEGVGAAEAEEETEILALDEPYIETVRCTTCNECTNKNPLMFAYNAEKQAYIKDVNAGAFRDLVESAEKCPVRIIHPGKPVNPDEPGLEDLLKRAEPFL